MPILAQTVTLEEVAKQQNVNVRTIRRWLNAFKEHGLQGLSRKKRADRSLRRMPGPLQGLIEGLYLQRPAPQITSIHRKVEVVCVEQGWEVPSYSTVYSIVRSLEPTLVTLAQEGRKVYQEHFDLLMMREASAPNEIWQADHAMLDILVEGESGETLRPWLTIILDDYSRAIPGYFIGPDPPSILRTALAFRQAIWRKEDLDWSIFGIPDEFYVDHGSDFTSKHLEQVAADLKVTLTFSRIGEPRGRGKIERFFRTVNQLFCADLPGYLQPGRNREVRLLTIENFEQAFYRWLVDVYMKREHSETRMSPRFRWEESNFIPRMPDSFEQLDLLLLTVKKARLIRQSGIHFLGMRYINLLLSSFVGCSAIIRYDPRDLSEIRVYIDDQFLCTAVSEEACGMSIKDLMKTRNHRRKELEREIYDRAEFIRLYMQAKEEGVFDATRDGTPSSGAEQGSPTPSKYSGHHKASRLKIYAADDSSSETED